MMPHTRYAKCDGIHLAYQIVGEGEIDVLLILGFPTHVELAWENPGFARMMERLARFSRVLTFDRRGTGLSDPVCGVPLLEERVEDLRAVMDDAGSEMASLFAMGEGGLTALVFAAMHPERVRSLMLAGSYARLTQTTDYPYGSTNDEYRDLVIKATSRWGEGEFLGRLFPTVDEDPLLREWAGRYERYASSPGTAVSSLSALGDFDVREVLETIRVPVMVLHRTGDPVHAINHGRYLAQHIPGAKLLELPGEFVGSWFDIRPEETVEIEEFMTGSRSLEHERTLATVLFTDIVGSTQLASELGDARWAALLERHDQLTKYTAERFGGKVLKGTGDGALVLFDGPARGIHAALSILRRATDLGLSLRAGIHTGEVTVGENDLTGIGVHIAARIADLAESDQVLVSRTVVDLVAGSNLEFVDRGEYELKGVPLEWRLYSAKEPAFV